MDRISILNSNGIIREVYCVPLRTSPYRYAGDLVRRHRHAGLVYDYIIEVSGQEPQLASGDLVLTKEMLACG